MRNRTFLCLGLASLALATSGALLSACSSSGSEDAFEGTGQGGAGGGWDESGGSYYGGTSSSGYGNGVGGGGGGLIGDPNMPPPIDVPGDAGPDAAFLCDGLDQSKPVVLYLSSDDSNSMSSPALARELLKLGQAPFKSSIRTYEFLNYYRIDYPAPAPGALQIFPQAGPGAKPSDIDLQIGVRAFDPIKPRRPITMTFVLDTSGSMGGPAIERERAAVKAIAASLASGDIVNMVTWNTAQSAILTAHAVSGPNDPAIIGAANALSADGGTDLSGGLVAGYALAKQTYGTDRLNRVVLISDGGANVGVIDGDLIGENSKDADKEGIYLVGVGAGPAGGYSDELMDIVTDKGRGAYVYLDTPGEATHMFVDRFDETMEIAARGVQVELTLPWYFKIQKFYGEEYSPNAQEIEPQHLAPGDAMVLSQILEACDASVINMDDPITVHATWKEPLTYVDMETSVTITVGALLAGSKGQLTKGKAIVAYAEALKTAIAADLHAAHDQVVAANPGANDAELNEIASLLELHPSY